MSNKGQTTVVVIIPFYNGSKFIARSLQSVFNQTIAPDEVIVVNDGSQPDERDFLYALQAHFSFRIIDKPNGGQGSARNAGVAASNSDFICLLDQDDFFLPRHIELLTKSLPLNDRQFGFVYADLKLADVNGNILFTNVVKRRSPENPKTSLINLLQYDMFVLPSASIISRKAFDAINGFDEQFTGYEDDDLFMRLFHKGFTNYFLDEPVTVWCVHSASTSFSIKMSKSRFRYFKKLATTFPDEEERGLFFFKDYLMPRFSREFMADVVRAGKRDKEHRLEVYKILRDYSAMVTAHRHVGAHLKARVMLTTFILTHCPAWASQMLRQARRLLVIRRPAAW